MRALRFHGVGDLRAEDVPEPTGETVIAVQACGVCGSDLHFLDGTARTNTLPVTLGHEIAGRVVTDSSGTHEPGVEVLVRVGQFCGECHRCREGRMNLCVRARIVGIDFDGGLAEHVAVPSSMVVERPPGLDAAEAATAVDAGATALHAVSRIAAVREGDSVLIIGAGGLGSYGLQFARLAGATPLIVADVDQAALDRAATLGADETIHVRPGESLGRAVKLLTDGGVDVAVEFVGRASTVDAAVKSLRPGGRAVVAGVGIEPVTTLPPVLWSNNEYSLAGAYGSLPDDLHTVLEAIVDGRVVTPPIERVAMDQAVDRIGELASGASASGRLVVIPD